MQSSTKKNLLIAVCYAGTMVLGMIIGPKFQREHERSNTKNVNLFFRETRVEKVDHVLNIIEENYVDPVKVDTMQDMAINQILKKLDPHSSYLPPVEAKRFTETLDGNYSGIGVEYQLLNDTVLVTSVYRNGPASKAGVRPGDQILKVNNETISRPGISTREIISLIKGRKGTEVGLLIKREGVPKEVTVVRDKITVSTIDAAYSLTSKVGYIKISKFGAHTNDDFIYELERLKKQGMNSLVLDLRGNGGGYLNAATDLADQFLPEKKLIVYTQGQHEPRTDYLATDKGLFEKGKLVVLIDEHSASASEILAGAIQDLDRGLIVGRRSFGKGLVQEQFNFGDGSALNLTVARYFTPSGRSIQKPYKEGADKYYEEVTERYKNGEVQGKHLDSLADKHKVFKTTRGRLIYGGGGIIPDVYVPIDTVPNNDLYYKLSSTGILNQFAFRNIIPKTSIDKDALDKLIKQFTLTEDQFKQLFSMAVSKGIKFSERDSITVKPALNAQIKALIARYYLGEEWYYKVKNVGDKTIARALDVLK